MPDGHSHEFDAWDGELDLGGRVFTVAVRAFGDEYILGRAILDEIEICFQFGTRIELRFENNP